MPALLLMLALTVTADNVIVPRLAAPPTIDGRIDPAEWRGAAVLSDFTTPGRDQPPAKAMQAHLGFDDQHLYLAVRCAEPHPAGLKAVAQPGSRDVWKDDCVEVWLRCSGGALDYDQFIVNSRGVTQSLRQRAVMPGAEAAVEWRAAAAVEATGYAVELAVPFRALRDEPPLPGDLVGLKIGREDYTTDPQTLTTLPAGSGYGALGEYASCYLERDNLLLNPDHTERDGAAPKGWGFSKAEDGAFFQPVTDQGRRAIKFATPGRYCCMQQSLKLRPGRRYRLSFLARGDTQLYARARCTMQPGDKGSTPYDVQFRAGDDAQTYVPLSVTFPTGFDGRALLIFGVADGWAAGTVHLADLRLTEAVSADSTGEAIPVPADGVTVITKLLVTDCRMSRGFCGTPVDGTVNSLGWHAGRWECGMGHAGAGVGYGWGQNEGVHVTFADRRGFDWVLIRDGAKARLYGPGARYDAPEQAPLLIEFPGSTRRSRALLPKRAEVDQVSFFQLTDGLLADVGFYRLSRDAGAFRDPLVLSVGAEGQAGDLEPRLAADYPAPERAVRQLADQGGRLLLKPDQAVHLLSAPLAADTPTTGLGLALAVRRGPLQLPLRIALRDPLDPRIQLCEVDTLVANQGRLVLDYPDQVWPAGSRLCLTVRAAAECELTGLAGESPEVAIYRCAREAAVPEALAHRKLLMRTFFSAASEARQWGTIRANADLAAWAKQNQWGDQVLQVMAAIDHASWLDPSDDLVRQYREWVYRSIKPVELTATVESVPGAPDWAVAARQAWLLSRDVAKWWLDHRLTPNGELGGLVGDDSDLYQNFADLPLIESDGVGQRVVEAGDRLMKLAWSENLTAGLNRHTTDPLHAYEEGINHLTLMTLWHYGDPVYLERAMENARSTEKLTVLKPNGKRFFKSQLCGAEDLRIDRATDQDGHCHWLMWHPSLEVVWYNRNPLSLKWMREHALAWLPLQQAGAFATAVRVADETVTATSKHCYDGGYASMAQNMVSLYQVTGDLTYLQPLLDDFVKQGNSRWAIALLPDYAELLPDDTFGARRAELLAKHPVTAWRATGDKTALLDSLKKDIAELQRFPAMYTSAEVYTDRVFLYSLQNAALCYTGGMWTRNRYARDHGVSWSGLGTDYAALVRTNRPDHLRVLLYNFSDRPLKGTARLWRLAHGRYRLRLGPDADGDEDLDRASRDETVELARNSPVDVELPPKQVVVLDIQQVEALDDLLTRCDLAVSPLDLRVEGDTVSGHVHNLGAAPSPETVIALVNPGGKQVATAKVSALAAPTDLLPKTVPFQLKGLGQGAGWRVVADPDGRVAEIDEDNNAVVVR